MMVPLKIHRSLFESFLKRLRSIHEISSHSVLPFMNTTEYIVQTIHAAVNAVL